MPKTKKRSQRSKAKSSRKSSSSMPAKAASRTLKKKRVTGPRSSSRTVAPPVNQCVLKFARMCADMFDERVQGVCVPRFPSRNSHKYTANCSGVMTIGGRETSSASMADTTGTGWIAVAPALANNVPTVWYTDGSHEQPQVKCHDTYVGCIPITHNGPYTSQGFESGDEDNGPQVSGRIVGVGLRIRYIGREDTKGGLCYGFVSPSHSSVDDSVITSVSNRQGTIKVSCSREWTYLAAIGGTSLEQEYSRPFPIDTDVNEKIGRVFPYSSGQHSPNNLGEGAPIMCFQVTGAVGNQFEFEVVQHCEVIGIWAESASTPNQCSVSGTDQVQGAFYDAQANRTDERSGTRGFVSAYNKAFVGSA